MNVVRALGQEGKEEQLEVAQVLTVTWPNSVTGPTFCVHPSFILCCTRACDSGCLWAETEWECSDELLVPGC